MKRALCLILTVFMMCSVASFVFSCTGEPPEYTVEDFIAASTTLGATKATGNTSSATTSASLYNGSTTATNESADKTDKDVSYLWYGEWAKTQKADSYAIKNSEWSLSSNQVSYKKIISSVSEINADMLEISAYTNDTRAVFDSFDEEFFSENILVYVHINTPKQPALIRGISVEKGEEISFTVRTVTTSGVPCENQTWTILLICKRADADGTERINVTVD